MRGQRNFHYLQGAGFVGAFTTKSIYSMYSFGTYPVVCLHGRHSISGEVYQVNDLQFHKLDELERYPDYYQRIEIPTPYGDAWMYIMERELCREKHLISGHWPSAFANRIG